jgi:hypothetical protein
VNVKVLVDATALLISSAHGLDECLMDSKHVCFGSALLPLLVPQALRLTLFLATRTSLKLSPFLQALPANPHGARAMSIAHELQAITMARRAETKPVLLALPHAPITVGLCFCATLTFAAITLSVLSCSTLLHL